MHYAVQILVSHLKQALLACLFNAFNKLFIDHIIRTKILLAKWKIYLCYLSCPTSKCFKNQKFNYFNRLQ